MKTILVSSKLFASAGNALQAMKNRTDEQKFDDYFL